jgi:hypothetical protein
MKDKSKIVNKATYEKTSYDESQNDYFILEQIDVNDGLDLKKLNDRE